MSNFEWAVVGAGPAGMLAVGKLLDQGVDPKAIVWLDPEFRVGDLGAQWRNVPSNTKVKLFVDFLNGCASFRFNEAPVFNLSALDPLHTCDLSNIADPLQWVSDHLVEQVKTLKAKVHHLSLSDRHWQLKMDGETVSSKNVVLALGAEPKTLPLVGPNQIALRDALDEERLSACCDREDTVAVFGSSHSAILVLRNLVELGVKRIVNFYQSPLRYAVEMGDWILFDNTGLKGKAAQWARDHIDGQWPSSLERVISSKEHLSEYLPECNKVVYAVGFSPRQSLVVEGMESIEYNPQSGIIAPGLFGVGIAFPECQTNPIGIEEHSVGLWKFMDYVNRVMPIWMKYGT